MKDLHPIEWIGKLDTRLQKSRFVSGFPYNKFNLKVLRPVRHSVTAAMEQSVILNALDSLFSRLLYLPLRVYGIFLIAFTVYTTAISFVKSGSFENIATFFFFGIGVILGGILLLSPKRETLASAICDSRIFSHLLFDILGLYKPPFEADRVTSGGSWWAFLTASAVSLLAFTDFITPYTLFIILLAIIALKITLSSPESGLLLTAGCLPFLPDLTVSIMVLCVVLSYLIKWIRGKRTFKPSVSFIGLLLFLLFIIIGALRVSDSAWTILTTVSVFFLAAILFNDRCWLPRAAASLTVSSILAAAYGVVLYLLSLIPEGYRGYFSFLPEHDFPITMSTPEFFGALYIAVSVLFLVRYIRSGGFSNRVLFCVSAVLIVLGTILSRSPMVLISVFAAVLCLLLLRKWQLAIPYILLTAGGVVGYIFFLPEFIKSEIEGFMNGFSTNPDLLLLELQKAVKSLAFGSGQGASESGNGYTHILTEWGGIALLVLLLTVVAILCYCLFAVRLNGKKGEIVMQLNAFLSAYFGLFVFSFGADVFQNESMVFIIFFLLGMIYAASGILIKEKELEDPVSELDIDLHIPHQKEKTRRTLKKRGKRGQTFER